MEGVMRICRSLSPAALALALVSLPPASAEDASFALSQHGRAVGTASFSIKSAPSGFNSSSLVKVSMTGLSYAISKTEELSSSNRLRHVQLSAIVNSAAVNVTAMPDAAQLLLNTSASGRSSSTRLAAHNLAVFLPDFDPGALQTLLTLAAANNNRGIWAIIPKKAGSVQAVSLATYADLQGTLNGQPVAVHHLVATISGDRTELFSGPKNQLLQAEFPSGGFALVRRGFVLKPPAKPVAPPAENTPARPAAPAASRPPAAPQQQ